MTLSSTLLSSHAELDAIQPAWLDLFVRCCTPNPFAHPSWVTTWLRHFTRDGDLAIVIVHDDGELVGVAPLYRRDRGGALHAVTTLQLAGVGSHVHLTETPQILVAQGRERAVLREIVRFVVKQVSGWHWLELSLSQEQGWFEPQWLPAEQSSGFVLHRGTRACVVLDLPDSYDELLAGCKRNLRESIRRSRNRLARDDRGLDIFVAPEAADLGETLRRVVRLHEFRAGLKGKIGHPTWFADPADLAFLLDAADGLARTGNASAYVLRVDSTDAAGRFVLHANRSAFLSFSGFDPAFWEYGVATTLTAECVRASIGRGDRLVNFSPGPDVGKLRWSEHLVLHQDFVIVAPSRRARLAFGLFWQLRAAAIVRRERKRHFVA